MNLQDIKTTVKTFILDLPREDPAAFTETIPLMMTGILNSIAVLKAVTLLENQFGVLRSSHTRPWSRPQCIIGHRPARDVEETVTRRTSGMRNPPFPPQRMRRHSYRNVV